MDKINLTFNYYEFIVFLNLSVMLFIYDGLVIFFSDYIMLWCYYDYG